MISINQRFRKFLPVVIDVETAGLKATTDALLELACVFLELNNNNLTTTHTAHFHILPFEGSNLNKESLEFNNIDPFHPFRFAISEKQALTELFDQINLELQQTNCNKAVLVGHNSWFDLSFINEAANRCNLKSPLHSFTTFDTATLGAAFYGHTVLAQLLSRANILYNPDDAHSALYDAKVTAELFCKIINNIR